VEYKKSEDFAKARARGKQSCAKKEHDHHLGRDGYAFAMPKWRKMEEDLLTQGTISAVVDWPERVKNWYYAHGGTINSEDGTLDYPPSLRETALEILKIIEDVRAGKVQGLRGGTIEIWLQGRHCHLSKLQKKNGARIGGTTARVRKKT
jgi:hypothetical protein